jgi:hypothetical protein
MDVKATLSRLKKGRRSLVKLALGAVVLLDIFDSNRLTNSRLICKKGLSINSPFKLGETRTRN